MEISVIVNNLFSVQVLIYDKIGVLFQLSRIVRVIQKNNADIYTALILKGYRHENQVRYFLYVYLHILPES